MSKRPEPEVLATLYPETRAKRELPINFNHANLSLFEHELERAIPNTFLLKFTDVRLSSEGLLFKGTRILPESFAFPNHLDDWKLRSVVRFLATNHLLRRRRRIETEVLLITDYWSKGYFHWLADALTRLYVVRDRLDDLTLVLPAGYDGLDYVRSSLDAFGIKKMDFIRPDEILECRCLFMPSHTAPSGHYNEEIIRGVRNVLLSAYGNSDQKLRVYISRLHATRRRILNESELSEILLRFGFQTIYAEQLSFTQQVQLCSRARCLVSNHGAGLTNMMFLPEGANVFEFRHQDDRVNNCYFTLASALDLNYFYQTCRPAVANVDSHSADLIVDCQKFEDSLEQLLSASSLV